MRLFETLILMAALITPATASGSVWQNVCPDKEIYYCNDVGKIGYHYYTKLKVGRILGVAWRPKGSLIGIEPAIPKLHIKEQYRVSPRDAYYYIIEDPGNDPFIVQCRYIDPK